MRVKLGEVARESRETLRGSKRGLPVVGLEHIMPGELTLSDWDVDRENTFTKTFRKGQMLFGRRRAYLKKAAVALFDGICSGDITVIEAIPEKLLPELLPFVIQNDTFFNYAVGKSAGSLSPRAKWQHLQNFEFTLPSVAEQRKLADLLWTTNATREAYKKLLVATDELIKSQFIEMFGDPVTNQKGWDVEKLSSLFKVRSSKRVYQREQVSEGVPFLRVSDLVQKIVDGVNACSLYISEELYGSFVDNGLVPKAEDILVTSRGTLGLCYIVRDSDRFYFQDGMISWLDKQEKEIDSVYVSYLFRMDGFRRQIDQLSSGSTVSYLSLENLGNLEVMLPDYDLQNRFADFVHQADKSKFELQRTIDELEATYKSLLRENLG